MGPRDRLQQCMRSNWKTRNQGKSETHPNSSEEEDEEDASSRGYVDVPLSSGVDHDPACDAVESSSLTGLDQ